MGNRDSAVVGHFDNQFSVFVMFVMVTVCYGCWVVNTMSDYDEQCDASLRREYKIWYLAGRRHSAMAALSNLDTYHFGPIELIGSLSITYHLQASRISSKV